MTRKFPSIYLDVDSGFTMVCVYFTVYWFRVAFSVYSRRKFSVNLLWFVCILQFTGFASHVFSLLDSHRKFVTCFASQSFSLLSSRRKFTEFASQVSVYLIRVASFSLLASRRKFQFTGSRRKFQFT